MLRLLDRLKLAVGRLVLRAAAPLSTGETREGLTRLAEAIDRLLEEA